MASSSGIEQVLANLDADVQRKMKLAVDAMETVCQLLQNYAKSEHTYTDRTANTTNSIRGFVAEITPDVIRGVLSAGMEYDVFLELARDGKWAFLLPTITKHQTEIMNTFASVMTGQSALSFTAADSVKSDYDAHKTRTNDERRADVDAAKGRESAYRQAVRDRAAKNGKP
jgi:hypothetical protein